MTKEEKILFEKGELLPLVEEFYTLQGEGFHTGKAAYFMRIGGCDVGCAWCDTKFSWNPALHPLISTLQFVKNASKFPAKAVVVTGGEPTTYNLSFLTKELKKRKIKTFLETSGVYNLTGEWDWICLSPKKQAPPINEYFNKANELKVIINKEIDLNWAEECSAKVNNKCKLYLQPEWSQYKVMTDKIVEYIKKNTKWSISLQAHKFMKIP